MEYIVSQLMDKDFRTIYFRRYSFAKNWKTAKKYMAIKKTDEYKNFRLRVLPESKQKDHIRDWDFSIEPR